MKRLADHVRQAHQDAEEVQVSSRKIVQQFYKIESVELEAPPETAQLRVVERRDDGTGK
jgi:DNA recombination protein RmuC